MDEGRCRSCGAPVAWVKMHASGKPNPLDPEPSDIGNVLVVERGPEAARYGAKPGRGVALKKADLAAERVGGRDLYLSHFATCPNRRQHRKAA